MTEKSKQEAKRWAISSVTTFLSVFLPIIILNMDNITPEYIETGAFLGMFITACRAGIKAVLESMVGYISNKKGVV